jgi:MoxR-like ATPase
MNDRQTLLQALANSDNDTGVFGRFEVLQIAKSVGLKQPKWFFDEHKIGRGKYVIDMQGQVLAMPQAAAPAPTPIVTIQPSPAKTLTQAKLTVEVDNLVPMADPTYIPFGFSRDLTKILKSGIFYPTFISGLSGNGKTTMVEQTCAKLKREALRVNISIETDEDDLIGGNTLVDGNVVYREGPVLTAMKRGAVLILDEIDRGSNKLMCLQAILEGKPYFNKKTGEVITPAPGFNIIATANTKGRGSDDGKFMSAQILDEAFLERFAITVEQEYPSAVNEKKIILGKMGKVNKVDEDFADKLVTWAEIIRKTFKEGAIDELVSTRRLEHIVNAYAMFDDRMKSIELCVNRFDEDTKSAFTELYTKVDAGATLESLEDSGVDIEAVTALGPGPKAAHWS